MKKIVLFSLLCLSKTITAQEIINNDTINQIATVVVTGTKYEEKSNNIVQKIDIISAKQIASTNAPSTGDLLMQTGQVFVQKSQLGGSSPVLRGFEANRLLLVVDGVRMNNAIYRGGHLQNVITVDQNMLHSVEILNGPASTLYGSDAIGGVINFTTKKIVFGANQTNAFARYSSACNEATVHGDVMLTNKTFGSITSISASRFSDLRAGANRNSIWGNVGLKNFTVEQNNGKDTMVANANPQLQLGTGYSQLDVLQKFAFKQGKHATHFINLQLSTSTDVPRYDRSTDMSGKYLRFAEWYYGPQKRKMGSYKLEVRNLAGFINDANINFNVQDIFESRNTRRYGSTNKISNEEKVGVIGFDANMRHKGDVNEMTFGLDGQYNTVQSVGIVTDIKTGLQTIGNSRFPDLSNTYQMYGAYVQNVVKITPEVLVMNAGLRFNQIVLDSKFSGNTPTKFPYNGISQNNTGVTGNVGFAFTPDEYFKISASYSSGFKAPNIDDAARLFESGGNYLVIPNEKLLPEYAHSFDLGISYNEDNKYQLAINGFYTSVVDAIVMDKTTYNGSDSSNFYGANKAVVALQNKALARVYGFSANGSFVILPNTQLIGAVTYTEGRYDAVGTLGNGSVAVPLDHIPPVFGKLAIAYNKNKFSAEAWTLFNGLKDIKDYNPLGASEDNVNYAIAGYGMPAWATINVKAAYMLTPKITLQAGLENIADIHYRHFASGISAPGRNAILAVRARL